MISILFLTLTFSPRVDSVLNLIQEKLQKVTDYSCVLESFEKLGEKVQKRTYKHFYLKPGWVKMIVVEGDNKGAEVSYNPHANKVRGHRGGTLRMIKVTLSPEDKRVQSLRGFKIMDASFFALLAYFKGALKNAQKVSIEDLPNSWKIIIDEIKNPNDFHGFSKIELYVDKTTKLPTEVNYYDPDNTLAKKLTYKNVEINIGLKEVDFEI